MRWASLQRDFGRLSVVTPPTAYPLDLATDIKPHLRISHNGEDAKLTQIRDAAIGLLDAPFGHLGRAIMPQTLMLTLDRFPPREVYLPCPPVTAIKTITYRDIDDATQTAYDSDAATDEVGLLYDLSDYTGPAFCWPDDSIGWPSDIKGGRDSVRITYEAGYADADAVPAAIKQWLLQAIGIFYQNPEGVALNAKPETLPFWDRSLDNLRVRM